MLRTGLVAALRRGQRLWTDFAAHEGCPPHGPSPTSSTGSSCQSEIYTAKKQGGCSDRLSWGYDRFAARADSLQLPTAKSCAHRDSQPPQPHIGMPLPTYFTSHRRNRSELLGNRGEFLILSGEMCWPIEAQPSPRCDNSHHATPPPQPPGLHPGRH